MKLVVTTCSLMVLLLSSAAFSAPSFETPPPRKIEQLERERIGQPWYVSTAAERYLARVRRVGMDGLAELSPAGHAPVPPAIGWGEIERIERRGSRRLQGGIAGAAIGAVALGFAGAAIGEAASTDYRSYNDHGAWAGIGSGLVLGALTGAVMGNRHERVRTLYVGAPAAGDGSRGASQPPESAVERARAHAGKLFRVRGSFGTFVGRVGTITPEGLSGLEPDHDLDSRLPLPAEPIGWSQISSIERRGSHVGRGAVIGALIVGGLTATLAGAVASSGLGLSTSGGSDEDILGAAAVGGVLGSGVGALVGAAVGAKFPGWHRIYRGTESAAIPR